MRITAFILLFFNVGHLSTHQVSENANGDQVLGLATVKSRTGPTRRKNDPTAFSDAFRDISFMGVLVGSSICLFGFFVPFHYSVVYAASIRNVLPSFPKNVLLIMNAAR